MGEVIVAKVGGSLFGLPDLRARLLDQIGRWKECEVLLVPGGGQAADVIRILDRQHGLGEGPSHWLALRMLTVNAHFLANLLDLPVIGVPSVRAFGRPLPNGPVAILDAHAFCRADEANDDHLDHSWRVTSDSVAARVATVVAGRLVLLKSREWPAGCTWEQAAIGGLVDEALAALLQHKDLSVTWVNLRRSDPHRSS